MRLLYAVCVAFFFLPNISVAEKSKGPLGKLYGMNLALDPGHTEDHPGAQVDIVFEGKTIRIREADYAFDLACLIGTHAQLEGANVSFTRGDFKECKDRKELPDIQLSEFKIQGVESKHPPLWLWRATLRKGPRLANKWLNWRDDHRVVFLSVHFESGLPDLEGAHFIARDEETLEVAVFLANSFRSYGLIRSRNGEEYLPITVSGSQENGVPNMFVLDDDRNNVRQSVILEPANLRNKEDVRRILQKKFRELNAELVLDALYKTNKLRLAKTRD